MTDLNTPAPRQDPSAGPGRPSPHPALYVALGIALAVAAAWATVEAQLRMLSRLFVARGVTPTFHSGEQWLALSFLYPGGIVVLVALLALLAIVLPGRYAALRRTGAGRIGVGRHIAIAGAAAFLLSLVLIGWAGTHVVLAIHAGPFVAMAILTTWLVAALMNRSLARAASEGISR